MDILNDFLTYMAVVQGASLETIRVYEYELNLFLKFMKQQYVEGLDNEDVTKIELCNDDEHILSSITLEDTHNFLLFCQQERGNKAAARARKVASIRSFYKYLYNQRRIIDNNVMEKLETPKIGKKEPIYLTQDEAIQYINGIPESNHHYRDKAMVVIILNCGLRVSELCGINMNDIRNGILTVRGKGNKERSIYINEITNNCIQDYIKYERNKQNNIVDKTALFLSKFGKRIGVRSVQQIIKSINIESNVNKPGLTTHKLRHTMATMTYRETNNLIGLQQLLGHDSINSTQIYTHVDREQLRELIEKNPLNKSDKDS